MKIWKVMRTCDPYEPREVVGIFSRERAAYECLVECTTEYARGAPNGSWVEADVVYDSFEQFILIEANREKIE